MSIERIFTRPQAGAPQVELECARVVATQGIEGDRYFGRHDEPGQNATFVEAEELEAFLEACGQPLDLSVSGRNLVTRGVRLNMLVGKEFTVGTVRFRGVELCEPCLGLGQALSFSGLPPADVVAKLVHRAGLRADVLSSGEVRRGARLEAD